MGGEKSQRREFADYPKYKENYIKAFDRMLEMRRKKGLKMMEWNNGEDVFRWWLGENPKQIRIEDILD